MEQNGCPVTSSSEAPFVMSQLLSKLDGHDNVEFGREMQRTGKGENVSNLIDWLMNEASQWLCIKRETIYHRSNSGIRSDNHANDSKTSTDQKCPLGCEIRHLLSACPTYQKADVNQRWEIVKQNNRCRKCLRAHQRTFAKNLPALLATNALDAIIVPWFIKSNAESTKIVDGRVQVRMPWRMISSEKSVRKKDYTKIDDLEVQELVELDFITESTVRV